VRRLKSKGCAACCHDPADTVDEGCCDPAVLSAAMLTFRPTQPQPQTHPPTPPAHPVDDIGRRKRADAVAHRRHQLPPQLLRVPHPLVALSGWLGGWLVGCWGLDEDAGLVGAVAGGTVSSINCSSAAFERNPPSTPPTPERTTEPSPPPHPQHSTAQHSTAQHSTAQHSAAQRTSISVT